MECVMRVEDRARWGGHGALWVISINFPNDAAVRSLSLHDLFSALSVLKFDFCHLLL